MNKTWRMLSVIFLCCLSGLGLGNTDVFAYFQDNVFGARPAGMGNAFVAVADDANSVLFNPAGLADLHEYQFTGMYASLFANLNARLYNGQTDQFGYNYLAAGLPISDEVGSLGVSWVHFNSVFYKENTLALSYAREVWAPYALNAGVNLKVLQWQVAANDFTTNTQTYPYGDRGKTGFTADLGMKAMLLPGLTVGLGMDNVVPVSMGLENKTLMPIAVRVGAAYNYMIRKNQVDSVQTSLETTLRNEEWNLKLGSEAWFLKRLLAFRLGIQADEFTTGMGIRYAWPNQPLVLELDYAFSYPFGIVETIGSHRIGMTLVWDAVSPARKPKVRTSRKPAKKVILPKQEEKSSLDVMMRNVGNRLEKMPMLPPKRPEGTIQLRPDTVTGKNEPVDRSANKEAGLVFEKTSQSATIQEAGSGVQPVPALGIPQAKIVDQIKMINQDKGSEQENIANQIRQAKQEKNVDQQKIVNQIKAGKPEKVEGQGRYAQPEGGLDLGNISKTGKTGVARIVQPEGGLDLGFAAKAAGAEAAKAVQPEGSDDLGIVTKTDSTPVHDKVLDPNNLKDALQTELNQFQQKIADGKLSPILFEPDKGTLSSQSNSTLNYLGKILVRYPNMIVRLEGHTDKAGNDAYNLNLSQRQVETLRNYLVENFKIPAEYLIPIGYGSTRPVASNETAKGRGRNRRIEFKVIKAFSKKQ